MHRGRVEGSMVDNKVKGASASRGKKHTMEMKGKRYKVENGREDGEKEPKR